MDVSMDFAYYGLTNCSYFVKADWIYPVFVMLEFKLKILNNEDYTTLCMGYTWVPPIIVRHVLYIAYTNDTAVCSASNRQITY